MYVRIAIRGAFPCFSSQSDVFANIKIFALSIDLAQFYEKKMDASFKLHLNQTFFANIKINFNINLILNILLNINFFNISKTVTYEKKGLFSFFKKK